MHLLTTNYKLCELKLLPIFEDWIKEFNLRVKQKVLEAISPNKEKVIKIWLEKYIATSRDWVIGLLNTANNRFVPSTQIDINILWQTILWFDDKNVVMVRIDNNNVYFVLEDWTFVKPLNIIPDYFNPVKFEADKNLLSDCMKKSIYKQICDRLMDIDNPNINIWWEQFYIEIESWELRLASNRVWGDKTVSFTDIHVLWNSFVDILWHKAVLVNVLWIETYFFPDSWEFITPLNNDWTWIN